MHSKKWLMLAINILGGAAVLGSYAWGFRSHADAGEVLWGGVPAAIRPVYTANMFLAAAGYFVFTFFILLHMQPEEARVGVRHAYDLFNTLYAGILIPSALWMPLTFAAIAHSSHALAWLVRLVLAVVGLASLVLLVAITKVRPQGPLWARRLALVGAAFFCLQTAFLDALVWSAFFQV